MKLAPRTLSVSGAAAGHTELRMGCFALILAAGRSSRFGRDKLDLPLGGKPVWRWSVDTFGSHPQVDGLGIVTQEKHVERLRTELSNAAFVVSGGSSRMDSVRTGLAAVPNGVETVLIHDAARPFVSDRLIDDVLEAARRTGAAWPGLPPADTVRQAEPIGFTTLDRGRLYIAQTPQAAALELLRKAYAAATDESTDDIQLLERIGIASERVQGDPECFKITTQQDYHQALAKIGASRVMETRTGFGYDIHAFSTDPDRPLRLGGILFEERPGLEGHSDADVLIHAVVDALLGAAGLGDIGMHYPPGDARWKNAGSALFLSETAGRLEREGWRIAHIDCSVVAEKPRILPHREEICKAIAAALGSEVDIVSVKATTNERLGAIGREEGIAAFAVATIARSS